VDILDHILLEKCSQPLAAAWPDFPLVLKEAVGVRVGQMLFAGLGSAGRGWFALDLSAEVKAWQIRALFPFSARNGAVAAAANGKIYVFGGSGRLTERHSLHQFDSIACYDPQTDSWSELAARLPVGMLGASAATVGCSIYIFGGYSKPQFDQLFRACAEADPAQQSDILHAFMDRRVEEFGWNDHVWKFDTRDESWHDLAKVAYPPNCGSGIVVDDAEIWLVSGEVKPGLRTAAIRHVSVDDGQLLWHAEQELPALQQIQEGVAAAFAGKCGGVKLLAGGCNFVGAREHYQAGKKYAHQGLSKLWRDEIYVLRNGKWELAGRLPQGRANGLAFEVGQDLLLVGGDMQNGQPCLETWLLSYRDSSGIIISGSKLK